MRMNYLCGCALIITVYPQYELTVINCFNSSFWGHEEESCLTASCVSVNTLAAEMKTTKKKVLKINCRTGGSDVMFMD